MAETVNNNRPETAPPKDTLYRVLRRNMVLAILLAALTPLFLVSGLILEKFNRSYREKVQAHLQELVLKHRQNIDGFLNEQLNIIRYVAATTSFEQLGNEDYLQDVLSRLQQQFSGVFEDLGVVDEQGIQLAYAGPFKLLKAHYADAEWFEKAMARQAFVSDVFLGLRGRPHFIVAVRQSHGGTHWILRATIDFRAFNTLVETLRIGRTGVAFILNREGAFQTRAPAAPGGVAPGVTAVMARASTGLSVVETADPGGEEKIYVGAALKNGEWFLIFRQDTGDAYQDLRKTRNTAMFLILLGSVLIVTTAWIVSQRLVARVMDADRTVNLMNRQVIETGKLAAIGELAAGIAHEINNPVAIMMEKAGWIQDLLEDENKAALSNGPEMEASLEEIRNQARRCKDITFKLLSFARKTDSRPRHLQLNDLVRDVAALSSQRAKYAGVILENTLDPSLPVINASPTEIQQVLLNLINNALDAMAKTGGSLQITTTAQDEMVVMEVRDTGPGIPPAIRDRVFQPFFTTKPVGKGTGLGLSICYGIIHKLGGRIEVTSEVDKGTIFRIYMPAVEPSAVRLSDAADPPRPPKGETL